jgi:hypothetical protein
MSDIHEWLVALPAGALMPVIARGRMPGILENAGERAGQRACHRESD